MSKSTPSVETILAQAVEIAEPAQRQGFVEQACGGDAALQRRVEQLIANHFQAGSFLERPAVALDPCATVGWGTTQSASDVGTVIGLYRLLEQIGEGGMGLVFVAEQHEPIKRRVALKIIKPGMDSRQVIARFEAERQALALMDHPHIAKVHDAGTTRDGRPYFVMELVRGTPITEYCDTHCLTTRQRLELFRDVCQAVQHAHQKGIIHRDLKPSNVLVSHHDVTPVVKVIDFGIAKATSGKLTDKTVYTAYAQMVGTPLYMSPEQAGLSDLDVDTRSDVYSLGVLLYEMLTGTTPFESETLKKAGYDEMRRIIREDEPLRPSARLSTIQQADLSTIAERRGLEVSRFSQQLRGELDWIVMKALEKDRNRRYESASAFAADVQRYLDDEPVQACPPSSVYRFRKFVRRNKGALVTAGLVAAALVIGTTVSVWQAVEANAARTLAGVRLENEKQARHDAEAHFQKALKAVKQMLTEVGDERVAAIPQMNETRQRLLEEALAFYTDLIAINPRQSQAYCERGDVYQSLGKAELARDDYQKAIECDSENAAAFGALGVMWTFHIHTAEGEKNCHHYLTRALELEPTKPRSHRQLAEFFYGALDRRKEEAAEWSRAAEVAPSGSAESYAYLGRAALAVGDRRAARAHFEKCLSSAPSHCDAQHPPHCAAYFCLGGIHGALGEYDQAVTAFTKALESPQLPSGFLAQIYKERGSIYTLQRKYEAALVDFERALDIRSNDFFWFLYKRRGYAHFYLKHYEQALADITRGVELRPDDLGNLRWIPLEAVASCPDEKFRNGMAALADKTLQALEGKPPQSDHDKTTPYCARASLYLAARKVDQADLVHDLLKRLREEAGPKSEETTHWLAILGSLLLRQQQYVTAEPILRECLAIRAQKMPDDWLRYNTQSMLGDALLGQKKYADAEPLLLEGYEGMKQREARIPPQGKVRLTEAVERIVRLYEASAQPDKARAWREKGKPKLPDTTSRSAK